MSEISTQSLYRKYRPETFDDVRGQDHVIIALKNSLQSNSLAHAYLFSGVRGTGKTSIARILAKELQTSPEDIIEIDAASHTGVDNIRELRDGVSTRPFSSDYKIYIIDEAHMLSKAAFNALLKTLEEPPSHVIFVLATTEKHKILDTIISRCQVFDFNRPDLDTLVQLIKDICRRENVTIDDTSALFIAKKGNGSFRDTLSFLQQVIAHNSKNINFSELENDFNFSGSQIEMDLLMAIAESNKESALSFYSQFIETGSEVTQLINGLLDKARAVLLLKNSSTFKQKYQADLSPDEYEALSQIELGPMVIKKLLSISIEMTKSQHPHIAFEVGLIGLFDEDAAIVAK